MFILCKMSSTLAHSMPTADSTTNYGNPARTANSDFPVEMYLLWASIWNYNHYINNVFTNALIKKKKLDLQCLKFTCASQSDEAYKS